MSDPFKAMVRHYDANVVAKGGQSIFTVKAAGAFQRAIQDRQWRAETPHVLATEPGPRPDGRAIYAVEPRNYIAHGDRPQPLDDRVFE